MNEKMNAKQRAGFKAVEFIEDGMTVGLGTGSTAYWMVERLGERVREGLSVRCVPTATAASFRPTSRSCATMKSYSARRSGSCSSPMASMSCMASRPGF